MKPHKLLKTTNQFDCIYYSYYVDLPKYVKQYSIYSMILELYYSKTWNKINFTILSKYFDIKVKDKKMQQPKLSPKKQKNNKKKSIKENNKLFCVNMKSHEFS